MAVSHKPEISAGHSHLSPLALRRFARLSSLAGFFYSAATAPQAGECANPGSGRCARSMLSLQSCDTCRRSRFISMQFQQIAKQSTKKRATRQARMPGKPGFDLHK